MPGVVVIDASVAVKWLVPEEDSGRALDLARHWVDQETRPIGPRLLAVEVANVLHRRILRQDLAPPQARKLLSAFLASGVDLVDAVDLHVRAMELANNLGQPAVYDAHYLALAQVYDCELWTADKRFHVLTRGHDARVRLLGETPA